MATSKHVNLLIVGAGPFGLSMAAYAKYKDLDYLVIGKPMSFWKDNMPRGMFLRSGRDWHLCPQGIHTIDKFLETKQLKPEDVEPLSLDLYLSYSEWFQEQIKVQIQESLIQRLDHSDNQFVATLDDGNTIAASNVLLAIGFRYFKNAPTELAEIIPPNRLSHTCDLVNFDSLKNKRCLIVGGRQSAYEWASLLNENGAAAIHVLHRHEMPQFTESDWAWVSPMMDTMTKNPGWFRNLPKHKRKEIERRFWAEGRLKLEPWLWPRIERENIKIWQSSRVVACKELPTGELEVKLDVGERLTVDHIILATGYKVNMENVPFLAAGNVLSKLEIQEGSPVLDENFQSNIPGLFITSMAATRDFGNFFAFTVSAVASAKIIGKAIKN
ncbi:MAG: NAD(P)-binding domain-containing protein [Thermodesulfobacteriota bacterium]